MIDESEAAQSELDFPIVGIGASAADTDALARLFRQVPVDIGMAFVLVQTGVPAPASFLATLRRSTLMPVIETRQDTDIEANHVYAIPPHTAARLAGSILQLPVQSGARSESRPVDCFLFSLSEARRAFTIGVVLAGTDSDGAAGLRAIRNQGGRAIAQSGSLAGADRVLPPEQIAAELVAIAQSRSSEAAPSLDESKHQARLFELLRRATQIDFSGYRPDVIHRRIAGRLALEHRDDFASWLAWLEENPAELIATGEDLLIQSTSFFREPEAFDLLRKSILPGLVNAYEGRGNNDDTAFRVWVPGCSTGQEVYSIAMSLLEAMGERRGPFTAQIFGTDISERAIAAARKGIYPEREVRGLKPDRQARFFTHGENGFQISRRVREMCVFARQNLVSDPPFSRIDLISCRNVLIWLRPEIRGGVIAAFLYALQPDGYLWLGHAESLQGFPELISDVDSGRGFYRKKQNSGLGAPFLFHAHSGQGEASAGFPPAGFRTEAVEGTANPETTIASHSPVLSGSREALLLVDRNGEIMRTSGDMGLWLDLPSGPARLNLFSLARPEIRAELTALFDHVGGGGTDFRSTILPAMSTGMRGETRVDVRRMVSSLSHSADAADALFLLAFNSAPAGASPETIPEGKYEIFRREWLASNEELNAVNEELRNRNRNLARLSDHLASLLSSTTIPILMLDNELRIRRVTLPAEELFGIRQIDVGRPIGDIRLRIREEDLDALVRRVIATLTGEEVEILDREGRSHLLRVRPYRTADHRIEGAVLAMIDIDQMRRAQNLADAALEFAESLIESVQTPLLVLNRDLRVRMANPIFLAVYGLQLSEIENQPLHALGINQWNSPRLGAALARLARGETWFEDLEFEQEVANPEAANKASGLASRRIVMINGRRIAREEASAGESLADYAGVLDPEMAKMPARGDDFRILLAVADITAQRRAEKIMVDDRARLRQSVQEGEDALRHNREELRALTASLLNAQDEERRRVSRELHDDVSQNLAKLQFDIEMLEQNLRPEFAEEKSRLLKISEGFGQLSNDLRRIAHALHPSSIDHLGLAVTLRGYCREFAIRSGIRVRFTAARVPAQFPPEIASSLYRITQEALRNCAKHAAGCDVTVRLAGTAADLKLTIRDNGPGFDREAVRSKGGLGLISMQERARLIHAVFHLVTEPGSGASITVSAPLSDATR